MIRSLLLKLGMLAVTIGVVFWARSTPHPPVQGFSSTIERQVVATAATQLEEQESRTAGSSSQTIQNSNIDAVVQADPSKTPVRSRLDLNGANASELESLPGIGAVLAQRVIAFRESVGRFQKIEDLRGVKGISAKKFERLKSLVMVSTSNSSAVTEQRNL